MTLEIQNLHVEVEGKEILHGVTITFEKGKIHALMGPNGSGKSTLANTIMGNPNYKVTSGKIIFNGEDITNLGADLRSKAGLFLSFQYPAAIPGLKISTFLREAVNARREKPLTVVEFHSMLKETMAALNMDPSFSRRYLNDGFSGGEKKRAEILQLMLLKPTLALLDETDSGLDVDAIKKVAEGINQVHHANDMGIVVITHYNRFLEYIQPDKVSIISNGMIIKTGGKELADTIEHEGFGGMIDGHERATH